MAGNDDHSKEHPGRKAKKIQIDVWEDAEASFYLALARLKSSTDPNPDDVRTLIRSVAYDMTKHRDIRETQEHISEMLSFCWRCLFTAGKEIDSQYLEVSMATFEEFCESEFGRALGNVFHHLEHFKNIADKGETMEAKTELSLLSVLKESLTNPGISVSQEVNSYLTPIFNTFKNAIIAQNADGTLRVDVVSGRSAEFEIFIQDGSKLTKVTNVLDIPPAEKVFYKVDDAIIEAITAGEGNLLFNIFPGAIIANGRLDLSAAQEKIQLQVPIGHASFSAKPESLGNFEVTVPTFQDVEQINEVTQSIEMLPNVLSGIDRDLQQFYSIPGNVKKNSHLRKKIASELYDTVHNHFPAFSAHVKSTITGYLAIPHGILDTEARHEESPRTGSYHQYLGKTIRNILKSKP